MGYYQTYRTKKDRRHEPTGEKSFDPTCRNNGRDWNQNKKRQLKNIKKLDEAKSKQYE